MSDAYGLIRDMSPQPQPPNQRQVAQNRGTYIPQHVQAQMQKQLERNLPGHLKQYAGAFMQQQVIDPSIGGSFTPPGGGTINAGAAHKTYHPTTHMPRGSDHKNDARAASGRPVTGQPADPEPVLPDHVSPEEAFDFIVHPDTTPPKRSLLPSNSSLPVKIALAGGGLVVLMMVFVVAKSLIGGSSALPSYVTVAQDQQALIHLVAAADEQQDLTVANQNFIATASLSLGSSQADMLNYLAKNGKKIKPKELNLKISATTDAQLSGAAAAATYNETFKQVMKAKLSAYAQQLQSAYLESTGEKGKALLSDEYTQAKLLLTQLEDTRS